MTDKPKRGRPPKAESDRRRNTINVRLDDAAHSSVERTASEAGRSLSGEIQHRVTDYESMRSFVDRLLDDSVAIEIAFGLETLRKRVRTAPANNISNDETASLERAVVTAACAAKLFETVAKHAGQALARKRMALLANGWAQRIDAGNLDHDFDIPTMADKISAGLSKLASLEGEQMAVHMGAAIGPHIWDICFNKDDQFRSDSLEQLLGDLDLGLPPLFLPPLPTEKDRQALVKKLNMSGAVRGAVKHRMSEGHYPGMSEKEAIDMLYDDLLKPFGMEPSEAASDAPTNQT